ncbi:Sodium-dependent nutrient amino acid transporter 1-like protein [Dinothrombium tinctorium]|uniref:Sodium-dependent nutrient amino acid transporter 1 n=1 Tax=Dinothrombium tinctorium TaxID=1965070 RepID=A0A3S3SGG7_9ACAR|nr:Sodium-dependent nutrient amino acid transporter 1-like protein [Dinothrombium tinctorium]
MALTLYYAFLSFQIPLPWAVPSEKWASSCHLNNTLNITCEKPLSQEFFENLVLHSTTWFNWRLAGCLILSWIIVYLSIIKSVASLGKVAYFTAIYPYLVLFALLIISLMQEGGSNGVLYFLTPDWQKIFDPIVWYRAAEQSFYSLNICFGCIMMFSSYNRFDNNVYKDSMIISVMDTMTSILAGCVVFAVLGSMAHQNNTAISEFVNCQGEELAFIVYPRVFTYLKIFPNLWSALFFFMLYVLGLGSTVSLVETILTCIREEFTCLQKHNYLVALISCVFYTIGGFSLTNNAGRQVLQIFNNYGVGTALFLYGVLEMIGLMWIYGCKRFASDLQFMSGKSVGIFWKITWTFICPIVLIVIFVFGTYTEAVKEKELNIVAVIGWAFAAFALSQIPIWAIVNVYNNPGTLMERVKQAISPASDWGPSDPQEFQKWQNRKMLKNGDTIQLSFITFR